MPLEAKSVGFQYTPKSPLVLQDVSLTLREGERVGLVAPSGAGKTTLVKILSGYERPTAGGVLLDGAPLSPVGPCPVQLIGQHPEHAVNPRWKMRRVLEEAGQCRPDVLGEMGIEEDWLGRFPRELSGGELQRFCVARALAGTTRFLVADEISTMLDVVTQAQIWNYLLTEVERRGMGLLVVTHDPALAARVCGTVLDLTALNAARERAQ